MRTRDSRVGRGGRVVQACFPERRIPAGVPLQRFVRGGMPPHPSTVAQRRAGSGQGMPLHPSLQRKTLDLGPGRAPGVQRREDVHAFQTPKGFLERSGPGDPLPAGVKQRMERYFSADFSDVRVHVGPEARSIGALAFTLGSDIYFAPEHYRPGTRAGQELLGHELTHVVQQREGRVANPFGDGVAVVQDFELEAEADGHGKAAAEGRRGPGLGLGPSARPGANTSGVQAKSAGYKLVVGAYMHEGRLPDEVAGHSFVAIEDPSGERRAFGFSPAHYGSYDPRRDMGRLKAGVAGVVHDDAGAFDKPGVKTQAYPITSQQAEAAMTKVAEYESGRHRYSADRQQCSTFALDVMRAARVEVPKAGAAPQPRVMYEALGGGVQAKQVAARMPVEPGAKQAATRWTGPPHPAQATPRSELVAQRMKRKRDDDDDYYPPGHFKQPRYTVPRTTTERVVRRTAHKRKHVNKKYKNVFTCPVCRRPLAFETKSGKLEWTRFAYTSKSGKKHKQRALELDHFPTWSSRLRKLKKRGATSEEIRKDHNDPRGLRALCRVCNGSHRYETKTIPDYDSDTDDEGYSTDDEEPDNLGNYKPFRYDPNNGSGGVGVTG